MDKVLHAGMGEYGLVFFHVEYEDERLSITGVEGPLSNGDARGGCGQIRGTKIVNFAEGWNQQLLDEFYQVWEDWHLNDMRAGCAHQRAEGWDKRPIDPSKPLNSYGTFFEGQSLPSWNMLAWVNVREHPEGLLSKPCAVCGYKFGTAWLKEKVPSYIISFLLGLPSSKIKPVWV